MAAIRNDDPPAETKMGAHALFGDPVDAAVPPRPLHLSRLKQYLGDTCIVE